jgi:tetratricopeptide (TPR) repeat protein
VADVQPRDAWLAIAIAAAGSSWPQAIEQYRLVLSMNPTRAQRLDTQALLGMALVRTERYEEAVSLYRAYLGERPADIDALSHLGIALLATNNLDEGLRAFRRAVDLDPDNGDMRRNLAAALFDRREIDEAAVHAERAVALAPGGCHRARPVWAYSRRARRLRRSACAVRTGAGDRARRPRCERGSRQASATRCEPRLIESPCVHCEYDAPRRRAIERQFST